MRHILLLVAALLLCSTTARAEPTTLEGVQELAELEEIPAEEDDEPAGLTWPTDWHRWGAWDYGALGLSMAGTVSASLISPRSDHWTGTNRVDESVRSGLRLGSLQQRQGVRDASDLTLSLMVAWPFLVDGLFVALWYHDSPDVARELALMAVEIQFITGALQSVTNMIASRQRPFVPSCGTDIAADDADCTGRIRYRSFFSGHTSQAFAAAATVCTTHARLPLYGGGAKEAAPCVVGVAIAALTAAFRVMADLHWFTDVVTGAVVGTAVGTIIPLLRMRPNRRARTFAVVPYGMGLALTGSLR